MNRRIHRTTFALDADSAGRLKRLAGRWQVSQSEVVRRSLRNAEEAALVERPDPAVSLRELHESGNGLQAQAADTYLAEVREARKEWRGE